MREGITRWRSNTSEMMFRLQVRENLTKIAEVSHWLTHKKRIPKVKQPLNHISKSKFFPSLYSTGSESQLLPSSLPEGFNSSRPHNPTHQIYRER